MGDKQSTSQSESYPVSNILIYSGMIKNLLFNDNDKQSSTDISSSPDDAFYDKEGKVPRALKLAYEKQKQ